MLILISPARTFGYIKPLTQGAIPTIPRFESEAISIGKAVLRHSFDQLGEILKDSPDLARTGMRQWQELVIGTSAAYPAVDYYRGIAYQRLDAASLNEDERVFMAEHLFIVSMGYGLLRSTDLIRAYRMIGTAALPYLSELSIFRFWRPILTDALIEIAQTKGGEICFLASGEVRNLLNWKKLIKEIKVVQPEFKSRDKGGRLRQLTIHSKIGRGLMARALIQAQVDTLSEIADYAPEEYTVDYKEY